MSRKIDQLKITATVENITLVNDVVNTVAALDLHTEHTILEIIVGANSPIPQDALNQILQIVTANTQTLKEIQVTDQEVKAVLDQVDVATNKIAANLTGVAAAQTTEADVVQTISNEIDALVANQGTNGISQATADQLTAIANRLQTSSDNSDAIAAATTAQVPTLQAIAAKGAPVVPPPPPPPVVPAARR